MAEIVTLYGLKLNRDTNGKFNAELVAVQVHKTPRQYRPMEEVDAELIKWNSLWHLSSHLAINGSTLGREYSEDPYELVNRVGMRLEKQAASYQRELERAQLMANALIRIDVDKAIGR